MNGLRPTLIAAVAAVAALGCAPAALGATTVEVITDGGDDVLRIAAAPGEENQISITAPTDSGEIQVLDLRTTEAPGAGCTSPFADRVVCPVAGIDRIAVTLGDRDDELRVHSTASLPVAADGGPGGDELDSWSQGVAKLDGGDGDDWLDVSAVTLSADTYIGGPGVDTVSLRIRSSGQTVSLDDVANDGVAGENDDIRSDIERVYGSYYDDTLIGSDGDDWLYGDLGDDRLEGRGGDDELEPGGDCWSDELYGGADDDIVHMAGDVDGGSGNDTISPGIHGGCAGVDAVGGPGVDVADFRDASGSESVSLDDVRNDGWGATGNYHSDIENLTANDEGMELIGSDGPNVLRGRFGDDVLVGGGGADTLIGGEGVDLADYADHSGPVDVRIDGLAADGSPGENDDVAADVEDLRGGGAADHLAGGAEDNVIDGGAGADTILGGPGTDVVDYFERMTGVTVDLDGEAGDDGAPGEGDTVGADVEGAIGGAGDDALTGNAADGLLAGAEGADRLVDPGGADLLDGGDGTDRLRSADGAVDRDACGAGADEVLGDALDDVARDCESVVLETAPPVVIPESPLGTPRRPDSRPPISRPPTARPVDRRAPRAALTAPAKLRESTLVTKGLAVRVDCDEACVATAGLSPDGSTAKVLRRLGLSASVIVGKGALRTYSDASRPLVLAVTAKGRSALRKISGGKFTLRVTVTDRAGNARTITKRIALVP